MIENKNLTVAYNSGKESECLALDNVCLTVKDGEMIAVTGKSGAGKSTLLMVMAGLISNYQGVCIVENADMASMTEKEKCKFRQRKIGLIFQDDYLIEECSIRDNLLLAAVNKKLSRTERERAVAQAIKKVKLNKKFDCKVAHLSGGEKKRVAIARALLNDHNLILADEPTGNLDSENSNNIISLFKEINSAGATVIIITHDKDIAAACDRVVTLSDGKIV